VLAVQDTDMRDTLGTHLELEGWSVVHASDGFCALRHARDNANLIVLDLRIPGADGLTVIRTLRREGFEMPILAIARDESEMVLGLELGADGFVPLPLSPTLLLSQVRALQRRSARLLGQTMETTVYLDYGRLVVDEAARVARVDDTPLALRPREFAILLALARNPGVALSRSKLVERVWGEDFPGEERTVDSHIRRIRAQMERFPTMPPCIHTVHGFGYKFEPPD
jgi:DNA-binding response OmpR family regulator